MNLLLPENIEDLRNFILYHILPGASLSTEFTPGPTATLFSGNTIEVALEPLQVNDANVLTSDILACNGYIDIIDSVLNPFAGRTYSFMGSDGKSRMITYNFCFFVCFQLPLVFLQMPPSWVQTPRWFRLVVQPQTLL